MTVRKLCSASLSAVNNHNQDVSLQSNNYNKLPLPDSNDSRIIKEAVNSQKSLFNRFITHLKFTLLSIVTIGMYAVSVINSLRDRLKALEDSIAEIEAALKDIKNAKNHQPLQQGENNNLSPEVRLKSPNKRKNHYKSPSKASPSGARTGPRLVLTAEVLNTEKGKLKKAGPKIPVQLDPLTAFNFTPKLRKKIAFIRTHAAPSDSDESEWDRTPELKSNKVARPEQVPSMQSKIEFLSLPIAEKHVQSGQSACSSSQQHSEKTGLLPPPLSNDFLKQIQEGVPLRKVIHPSKVIDDRHVSSTLGAGAVEYTSSLSRMPEELVNQINAGVKLNKVATS